MYSLVCHVSFRLSLFLIKTKACDAYPLAVGRVIESGTLDSEMASTVAPEMRKMCGFDSCSGNNISSVCDIFEQSNPI